VLPLRAIIVVFTISLPASLLATDLLTIGSDAPPLAIEHWIQDGGGKFKPVTKFKSGNVYVVEFWATWCVPCIQSMPHLANLQNEYAKKGVQIISVTDEDVATVDAFLKRPAPRVPGMKKDSRKKEDSDKEEDSDKAVIQTYRDITSAYCLTADPDLSTYGDYMTAAAQLGIPTSFIVGKDGKVEWIGHPGELEGPLQAVVADRWDREKFLEEILPQQKEAKERIDTDRLNNDVYELLKIQDFDGALKLANAAIGEGESLNAKMIKLRVLIAAERLGDSAKHLTSIYDDLVDSPQQTEDIAWTIYTLATQMPVDLSALLKASIAPTKAALEKALVIKKPSMMDTLAHLLVLTGDLDQAIQVETAALKLEGNGDSRAVFENFLRDLHTLKNRDR